MMRERGLTLMEVVIASTLAMGVIIAITSVDATRVRLQNEILQRQGAVSGSPEKTSAALSILHIAKHLENADRLRLLASDNLQVRIPVGLTFDAATDYRWDQYRYDLARRVLRFYSNTASGCSSGMDLAGQIGSVSFTYRDEAPAPPWDPPGVDPNVMAYAVEWNNGAGRSQVFPGLVTLRAAAYTDVTTGLQDPAVGDVSPPPPGC